MAGLVHNLVCPLPRTHTRQGLGGDPLGFLKDNAAFSLKDIDRILTVNDMSVIAMYTQSMAIIAQLMKGPKAVPGYGFEDFLFIAR